MDFTLAQLALIFTPGIIWANIDSKFGSGLKPNQTTFFIRAFIFGMATYSVLYLLYYAFDQSFGYADLAVDPSKINLISLKDEVALSIPLSFVLSVFWLWFVKYKVLKRFLHYIGASRRYGDEDVWSYTLNSDDKRVEYVHLRDLDNGFIFSGWVNTYSESEDFRELVLSDAIVYDEQGNEVSRPPILYISRPRGNIWLEFPYGTNGD
jgi:hypothetical protein